MKTINFLTYFHTDNIKLILRNLKKVFEIIGLFYRRILKVKLKNYFLSIQEIKVAQLNLELSSPTKKKT